MKDEGKKSAMAEIPADIVNRVLRDFGGADMELVARGLLQMMAVLAGQKVQEGNRVARCVVQYAGGDWKKLEYALEIARQDYRDAIMMGEYERVDGRLARMRDLSKRFE